QLAFIEGEEGFTHGKSEIRRSRSETNPKSESSNSQTNEPIGFGHSDFVLRICFGFRPSDFGFTPPRALPSPARATPAGGRRPRPPGARGGRRPASAPPRAPSSQWPGPA